MTSRIRVACIGLGVAWAVVALAPEASPKQPAVPPNKTLGVKLFAQRTDMWCWAASGQMVMEFLGRNVEQCDQANARFGLKTCCGNPTPGTCARGGWPEFYKWGFSSLHTNGTALSAAQLQEQIGVKNKPVAFSWGWTGGGGHMMVAVGYSTAGGQMFVSVNDPWPWSATGNGGATYPVTYARYVSGPNYVHWDDYYDVTRVPGSDEPGKAVPAPPPPSPNPATAQAPGTPPEKGKAMTEPGKAVAESRKAAEAGFQVLQALDTKREGPGAVGGKLGDPFPVVHVGLDRLKAKEPGGPKALFDGTVNQVLYPVVADEKVTGAVQVDQGKDGWEFGGGGNPALVRLLDQARTTHMRGSKAKAGDYRVLAVPALNQYFVALRAGGRVTLIPVTDAPDLGLKAGAAEDADAVFPRLVEAALKHDGNPS